MRRSYARLTAVQQLRYALANISVDVTNNE
jgi:hypothetical protein